MSTLVGLEVVGFNMSVSLPEKTEVVIRSMQYRDIGAIESLAAMSSEAEQDSCAVALGRNLQKARRWYGFLKFVSLFPNPAQHNLCVYVAEQNQQIIGCIKVSPFNSTRSTWRVEQVLVDPRAPLSKTEVGSQLLRYCFEKIWEARTWILEVNINNKSTLALYRHNGFQPLAQLTYWALVPELLEQLAQNEPDLPNLLPVSNVDAQLIYQLDTVSMPPLLRQVFDRHIRDFKTGFLSAFLAKLGQWMNQTEVVRSYVFEPQRKAAIGYFRLENCCDGTRAHQAELTVHPAYTWLYPELLSQMAQIVRQRPPQALQLVSADYQPEREEYFEQLGAQRMEHTLLMSRSVWHKLREAKQTSLERLQLSEVLQGLQPRGTPAPGRMSWWAHSSFPPSPGSRSDASGVGEEGTISTEPSERPENGHQG